MSRLPHVVFALAAVSLVATSDNGIHPDMIDRFLIQGTWELVSAADDGRAQASDGNRIVVQGDEWTAGSLKFKYRFWATERPKRIDWVCQKQVWKGIYDLTGDTMRLCVSPPDQPRPTEFVTKPGDRRQLHVRRRVEPTEAQ